MTKLAVIKDINGVPIYQIGFPTIKYSATITAAGGEKTLTVPGGISATHLVAVIRYEPGTTIWFALNATAAVPVGATFASTTSCLNYPGTVVVPGDVLHFITADTAADIGVEFYES